MQRKPGHPACSIKVPGFEPGEEPPLEPEEDSERRRRQLLSFGHTRWGFDNWSWAVTRQDLDFVDYCNGKYSVGVVSYVKIYVKSLDIYRENIGYASCVAVMKGSAIHQARKCAVTNALRETLLSFGGTITAELLDQLEVGRRETTHSALSPAARPYEPAADVHNKPRTPPAPAPAPAPPVARAHPMVVTPAPAAPVAPQPPALAPPKPNVSVVLQPVYSPRAPAPHYYEVGGAPWQYYHEDVPRAARPDWVKPSIFYDGFWTEHKVKKWVAEQVDKRLPPAHLPHLATHLPHLQHHPHYSHHLDVARGYSTGLRRRMFQDMKRAATASDDEEARAERKRRQRLAQEHFRHRHHGDQN